MSNFAAGLAAGLMVVPGRWERGLKRLQSGTVSGQDRQAGIMSIR